MYKLSVIKLIALLVHEKMPNHGCVFFFFLNQFSRRKIFSSKVTTFEVKECHFRYYKIDSVIGHL